LDSHEECRPRDSNYIRAGHASPLAKDAAMRNEYRVGPVYRAGLIVSGGMCAGLGVATLIAQALHLIAYAKLLPASAPTPPASALGFVACGLALIGIGVWFPRVTSVLAMVTLGLAVVLAGERVFGTGPRAETLIAVNVGAGDWHSTAPNTVVVLLLGAMALLLRHTHRWCARWLGAIAILGSIIFAIGVVGCVGYMTGVPSYAWQSQAPMSFLSAICSCVLGLGIVMSACRYIELDESGRPRWFSLVICIGALAINLVTAVAYLCNDGQTWNRAKAIGLLPMLIVSATLSSVAARKSRRGARGFAPSW
jgi:hypothetical protein